MVWGCSDIDPVSRLVKYEYPRDSLQTGKRFVYKKMISSPDVNYDSIVFINRKVIENDGETYFVLEGGEQSGPFRSRDIFRIVPGGYEYSDSYYFDIEFDSKKKDSVRNSILLFRSVPGYKYRGVVIRSKTSIDNVTFESKLTETFLREDSIAIMGKMYHALTFQTRTEISSKNRLLPFKITESAYDGEYTLAEGMDMVSYSTNMRGVKEVWQLVRIEDL